MMKLTTVTVGILLFVVGPAHESARAGEMTPRTPPGGFDQPDIGQIVKKISVGDALATIFGAQPSSALWRSPRNDTVFTVARTSSCYFYPQRRTSTSVVLCIESNMSDLRNSRPIRVEVSGLHPDTVYYYRANDSREYVRFRTAPEPGTFIPYQMAVVTDSQGPYDSAGRKDRYSLGEFEQANVAANYQFNLTTQPMRNLVQPDFSLHWGDVVEDARYWIQWEKELYGDLKYYLTHAPCIPAIGNHEYQDPRWWPFFDLPTTPQDDNGSTRAYFAALDQLPGRTSRSTNILPECWTIIINPSPGARCSPTWNQIAYHYNNAHLS